MKKKTIWLSAPGKRYPIHFQTATQDFTNTILNLAKKYASSQLFIITDSTIKRHYQSALQLLQTKGIRTFSFKAGAHAKTYANKIALETKLFKAQCSRNAIIIALGGGVVTDLAGFVAATFMRGIRYITVPTTLLAMADAAIGGKTAIDTPYGKNLIGAFHHPEAVIINLTFLDTLPQQEYKAGLAEVVKYALIENLRLYKYIEKAHAELRRHHPAILSTLLSESVRTKVRVVTHDEHEGGYRRILNFGHTLGHAIEQLSVYSIKHGFAVSMGMALESWLSHCLGHLRLSDFHKIIALLKNIGLPIVPPPDSTARKLYTACLSDKKNKGGSVRFTALKGIGKVVSAKGSFVVPLEYDFFRQAYKSFPEHHSS